MLSFSLPFPQSPVCDSQGIINRDWYLFFTGLSNAAGNGTGASISDIQAESDLRRTRGDADQLIGAISDTQLLGQAMADIGRLRGEVSQMRVTLNELQSLSQAIADMRRQRTEIDKIKDLVSDLQLLVLAQQRSNGATVSQNSRVANNRLDGP